MQSAEELRLRANIKLEADRCQLEQLIKETLSRLDGLCERHANDGKMKFECKHQTLLGNAIRHPEVFSILQSMKVVLEKLGYSVVITDMIAADNCYRFYISWFEKSNNHPDK